MRYLPMILAAGLMSVGLIATSSRSCRRRDADAHLRSFRCRGHVGRKGWLLLPPSSLWLSAILRRLWLPKAVLRLWLPTALLWLRIWIWASLALLREGQPRTSIFSCGLNRFRWARQSPPESASTLRETRLAPPAGVPGFLRNPSHFARLGLCRLPNLDEQHIVSSIGAAFENNLRPIVRLGIDGKELGGRMRNDDEIAADFDLNFRVVGHCPDRLAICDLAATSLNKGCLV